MRGSATILVDALNRLGGRQDAPATHRDLVAAAPPDLPLVAVRAAGSGAPTVTAVNVEAFLARALDVEGEAFAALMTLVRTGHLPRGEDPGADPAAWVTANRRGVARQGLQWALDHPGAGLDDEAFALARLVLGDPAP